MIITVNDYSENMKLFLFHSKVGKTQHFSYVSRIQRFLWCFPIRENYVISPFLFPNKKSATIPCSTSVTFAYSSFLLQLLHSLGQAVSYIDNSLEPLNQYEFLSRE